MYQLFFRTTNLLLYCHFSYAETWELLNLFVGTKIFSYHICYENLAKYSRVKAKVLRLFSAKTDQYACEEACIK